LLNYKKLLAILVLIVLLIAGISLFIYVRHRVRNLEAQPGKPNAPAPSSLFASLSNPSRATSDPNNRNNYLLVKRQYTLSYNNEKGGPNWVSWSLQASDIGNAERQNNFHPEMSLPNGFKRITPNDYTGSGFDRGHVCNSKDRSTTPEDNSETFSMANMLPQTPDLNRQVWESLESYCRSMAQKGNQLFIIAGGYGTAKTIGKANKVTVPTNCWKIIVFVNNAQLDKNTRVIAVDMPNVQGIALDPWQKYLTTVRDLEQKTGYDFFPGLPQDVKNALETKRDAGRP
jgi:endonuclease G